MPPAIVILMNLARDSLDVTTLTGSRKIEDFFRVWEIFGQKIDWKKNVAIAILPAELRMHLLGLELDLFSCVYKCVCQQHSEQMYRDLVCKITAHLEKVSLELQATSPEHYIEKFNLALSQYMGALHSIVPLFIYMNKFYIETKLNRDLKDDLIQLFTDHVADKHIYSLMPLLLEAQSTPFRITPSTMASIIKGLYTLRPEWVQLAPVLFSKFIPNILPPAMESELQDYAAQDRELQRDLMQNGFNRGDQSRKRAGDELSYNGSCNSSQSYR
ncbi:CDK2-associated and cullin domain-containing protein 1 [Rhinoderma darwinii]|uniref:CDK2-associated and cullin domain-containing protein 1 n=1 Tax=Rhinoderma darwinii TaxID=43563 RepID=UPI003F664221